jgi:hypothetical protein
MFKYFGYGGEDERDKEEKIQKTVVSINEKVKEKEIEKNRLEKKLVNLKRQLLVADENGADENLLDNLGSQYEETERQLNYTNDILKNLTTQKYTIERSISNKNTVDIQKDVSSTITSVNLSIKETDVIKTQIELEEGISQTDSISSSITKPLRKPNKNSKSTTKDRLAQWKTQEVPSVVSIDNNVEVIKEKQKIKK